MSFTSMYKRAASVLTPLAQAAAQSLPPPAPAPMGPPPGAPMDPSMAGGIPPQGAPMDPSMMGGAPMPPQGVMPMDPSMMGGMPPQGAPMDPSMMGAPAGAPPAQPGMWMQDQMFMQFLMQAGFQMDQQGNVIDPNGQPIPPEMMDQLYAEFQAQAAQMGGMPPGGDPNAMGGAPMDPSMMGGAPMDPAMGGMPADPNAMPPEGDPNAMPQLGMGLPEDMMNQIASIVTDAIDPIIELKIAALDKKISAFADKLDTVKALLEDNLSDTAANDKREAADAANLNAELMKELLAQQPQPAPELGSTEAMLQEPVQKQASLNTGKKSLLELMRGK